MQTLEERRKYWGLWFMELEINAVHHIIEVVESIDTNREPHNHEDMIKLRMIRKRKQDTEKLWEYLIKPHTK